MKKFALILTIVAILVSASITVSAEDYAVEIGTADYATVIPVIDGEIDSVWYDTAGYKTSGTHFTLAQDYSDVYAIAEIRVLWTEDALYVLAKVSDSTLPTNADCTSNCVNFWVSENNTQDMNANWQEAGDWFFCINHHGTVVQYDSNGETPTLPDEYAVKCNNNGYVVEFKMSIKSEDLTYSTGHIIGFNVSCDDEWGTDGIRDTYNNLYDNGWYWSNPGQLPHFRLVKSGCVCDVLCEDVAEEACPLCSVNIADCSGEKMDEPVGTEPTVPETEPTDPTEPETDPTEPTVDTAPQETGFIAWIKLTFAKLHDNTCLTDRAVSQHNNLRWTVTLQHLLF